MEKVTYKKSLYAKLSLSKDDVLEIYQTILDAGLAHKGVTNRLSFNYEKLNYGRQKVACLKIARTNLAIYFPVKQKQYAAYPLEDVSAIKANEGYPSMLRLKTKKSVKQALEIINSICKKLGSTEHEIVEDKNYRDVYYTRSFDELVMEGYIKKYVRKKVDGKTVVVEEKPAMSNVTFNATLMYEATNNADKLFIVTNYNNWNINDAIEMTKTGENFFTVTKAFPKGYKLEFKICRSESWADVEKGIWKEEIENHHYITVDDNITAEDLIYNFRHE